MNSGRRGATEKVLAVRKGKLIEPAVLINQNTAGYTKVFTNFLYEVDWRDWHAENNDMNHPVSHETKTAWDKQLAPACGVWANDEVRYAWRTKFGQRILAHIYRKTKIKLGWWIEFGSRWISDFRATMLVAGANVDDNWEILKLRYDSTWSVVWSGRKVGGGNSMEQK